jgi:hypothetical protein
MKICLKLKCKNLTENFSSEIEFCKIDPRGKFLNQFFRLRKILSLQKFLVPTQRWRPAQLSPRRKLAPWLCVAGLPDGLFTNQKSQFGQILQGLGMENVSIFYDQLEYFSAI